MEVSTAQTISILVIATAFTVLFLRGEGNHERVDQNAISMVSHYLILLVPALLASLFVTMIIVVLFLTPVFYLLGII